MRRLLGSLALATCAVLGTSAPALAQTPRCDAYSGACVGGVKKTQKPEVRPNRDNSGLPVTGGQVIGLLVLGGGAVAGGSALTVAGRKRRTTS
jgi:LPXTG-motif cell wall-anchored protein